MLAEIFTFQSLAVRLEYLCTENEIRQLVSLSKHTCIQDGYLIVVSTAVFAILDMSPVSLGYVIVVQNNLPRKSIIN